MIYNQTTKLPVAEPVCEDPAFTAATPAANLVTSRNTGGTIIGLCGCVSPGVNLTLSDSLEFFDGLFIIIAN